MIPDGLIASSFAKQLAELNAQIISQWSWPSPEAGFALHIFDTMKVAAPVDIEFASIWTGATFPYAQSLATAGYALSLGSGKDNDAQGQAWSAGLDRLKERDAFPADRQSFAFRPFELLGIALGAHHCEYTSPKAIEWLKGVIARLEREGNADEWSSGLYGAAACKLSIPWRRVISPDLNSLPAHTLGLYKWLGSAYAAADFIKAIQKDFSDLDEVLLVSCSLHDPVDLDLGRSAVLSYALKRAVSERIESELSKSWQVNRESVDALAIVTNICRRFPLFAKQLQIRRKDVTNGDSKKLPRPTVEMKDEYDVQDALNALLRLHFDDVRPEEWTPSYAGGQRRMDFLLKSEKIVVEAKMTRQGLSQTKVAGQLGEDKVFYKAHPDCQTLVCFVYDPEGFCHNPVALENDTEDLNDEFRVIVIVSPKGL